MNNNTTTRYYDYIDDLPYDENKKQSDVEMELIRTLFKKNQSFFSFLLKESWEPFLVGLLFLIFYIPYTENVIKSIFPITNNLDIILVAFKIILVMIGYWIMKMSLF